MPIRAEVDEQNKKQAMSELQLLEIENAKIQEEIKNTLTGINTHPQAEMKVENKKGYPVEPRKPKKLRTVSRKSYAGQLMNFRKRMRIWREACKDYEENKSIDAIKKKNIKIRKDNKTKKDFIELNKLAKDKKYDKTDESTYYYRKAVGEVGVNRCEDKTISRGVRVKKTLNKKERALLEEIEITEALENKKKKEEAPAPVMDVTEVYNVLYASQQMIKVLQGSSRSSKTYSILQYLITKAMEDAQDETLIPEENIKIKDKSLDVLILRSYLSTAKTTVFKDFRDIMLKLGLWNGNNFNKTSYQYKFFNTTFMFGGTEGDGGSKFLGKDSWRIFLNEISEISKDSYDQVTMRCKGEIIVDFNPKMSENHYVFKNILAQNENYPEKIFFHISNFQMNPFCPKLVRERLEGYEPTSENIKNKTADEYLWSVYGLGHLAKLDGIIYDIAGYYEEPPTEFDGQSYGLDFGWNHPMGFVNVIVKGNNIYIQELYYGSNTGILKNPNNPSQKNLEDEFAGLGVDKTREMIADSANPLYIADLKSLGYNIKKVKKPTVFESVMQMKQYNIYVRKQDVNLIEELETYRWATDRFGNLIEKTPINTHDDLLDAVRYALLTMSDFAKKRFLGKLDVSERISSRKLRNGSERFHYL